MTNDLRSPFNWRLNNEPSIFAKDPAFRPRKDGKTSSQIQSEVVDERRSTGENVGSLHGMGNSTTKTPDERINTLVAYKQFGTYSKAHPSKKPNKHEK